MTFHSSPRWVGPLWLVLAPCALAADFYVSLKGHDQNPGTLEAPLASLDKASALARAGDQIILRAGVYHQQLIPQHSGSPSAPITYRAYDNETVHLRGRQSGEAVVYITQKDWIVLRDLHIRMRGYGEDYAQHVANIYLDGASHNLLDNLRIENEDPHWASFKKYQARPREYGIVLKNHSTDNVIQHSHIHHMTHQGIHIKEGPGVKRTIIRNNDLSDNYGNAISLSTTHGQIAGTLIEGNILSGSVTSDGVQSNRDFAQPQDAYDKSSCGVIIRHNIIAGNAENGIDPKGACRWVIEGNMVYATAGNNDGDSDIGVADLPGRDRRASDCALSAGSLDHSQDFIIRDNVIYDNLCGLLYREGYRIYHNALLANHRDYTGPNSPYPDAASPYFQGVKSAWEKPSGRTVVLKNNIIGGNRYQIHHQAQSRQPLYINHNLYYGTKAEPARFVAFRGKGDYDILEFAAWRQHLANAAQVSGKDQQSVLIRDPQALFVNLPWQPAGDHKALDFRLKAHGPGYQRAEALTRTTAAGQNSQQLPVEDAQYFHDGMGVTQGDSIRIAQGPPLRILHIDYENHILHLEKPSSWPQRAPVSLAAMGTSPSIGPYRWPQTPEETERLMTPKGLKLEARVQ